MAQKSPLDWMRDNIWQFIGVVVAIITLIVSIIALPQLTSKVDATKPTPTPVTTNGSIVTPTITVTPTVVTTPSASPTPTPIPTKPTLAQAKVLPENIRLKCNACSDPVVITITKIEIQPSHNRMIWFLTFDNSSQDTADASFQQFSLEEGNQINNPTGPGEPTYDPTGPVVEPNGLSLLTGEVQYPTLTFSLVPYQGVPYTLISELVGGSQNITFNPVIITF